MKILKSSARLEILQHVKDVLWDKQALKELGEPIIYSESQTWLIALEGQLMTGFFVYEEKESYVNIHYMYVTPELRRLKIAEKLYNEFSKTVSENKPIRAIATKMSLNFFKSIGFNVTKEFVNYFKVEKI